MNRHQSSVSRIVAGVMIVSLCATVAHGNVYPSALKVQSGSPCGAYHISYVLNEDADGDGSNDGVTIQIYPAGGDPDTQSVRTISYASQPRGLHVYAWDGTDDLAQPVSDGNYQVRVTATDDGHTEWTQISVDNTSTSFFRPNGVSVNKDPESPNYGTIYISEGITDTTAFGRSVTSGIYLLRADGSAAGFADGGVNWAAAGDLAPWKSTIGQDGHLYVTDFSNDLVYEFSADMSTATALIDATNKTEGQFVEGVHVEGTQAGNDRRLYLVNGLYLDPRVGLIEYNLAGNPTATASDTGTQYIGPDYFAFYPRDVARDSSGDWYLNQFRFAPNEAPAVSKFLDATPPINTAAWETDIATYTGAHGLDIHEPAGVVAYCNRYDGRVYVFNLSDGTHVDDFAAGFFLRDVAFDAAGNLVTVDSTAEWARIWSPGNGPNGMATDSASFGVSGVAVGGPTITAQPADQTGCPGGNVTFNVSANSSGGALQYRWYRDGEPLSGETTDSLTLTGVTGSDVGAVIQVDVCDDNGFTSSDQATILAVGPRITVQPENATGLCTGDAAQFTVTAVGSGTLNYQWKKNDVNVGTNSPSLTIAALVDADDGAQITVTVTDDCGASEAVTSDVALILMDLPVITAHPQSKIVFESSSVILTVVAESPQATTLAYQWRKDNINLPGETDETLSFTAELDDAGEYDVVVTDDCGSTVSTAATVTVVPLPCNDPFADADGDGDVDQTDFARWQLCASSFDENDGFCLCADRNNDGKVDGFDLEAFELCASGPDVPADPDCDGTGPGDDCPPGLLFCDDFNQDSGANYHINISSADTAVTFAYDYSLLGIPPAPSGGGSTLGLKMEANITAPGAVEAVTVSPVGESFGGRYMVRFDMWINANGPFPAGGTGSTEFLTAGIGYDDLTVNLGGTSGSGGWFTCSGEGGSSRDYRAYKNAGEQFAESGQFFAGTSSAGGGAHNNTDGYYSIFGSVDVAATVPNQTALYPNQTGTTAVGTVGFTWYVVTIEVDEIAGTATWSIGGLAIAELDANVGTAFPLSGNISVGYMDIFTSVSDNSAVSFGLIDNLRVIDMTP